MTVIINGMEYVPRLNLKPPAAFGSLGSALKELRKAQRLSLQAASERIGCTKSHLHTLERDGSEPGLLLAHQIAEAYGVPLLTLALCASLTRQVRAPT